MLNSTYLRNWSNPFGLRFFIVNLGAQNSDHLSQKFCRSNDHIDILLDVLEEKPTSDTNSSPSKSTGAFSTDPNSNPPPIPPKPSISSSLLYSTLPTRTSTRVSSFLLQEIDLPNRSFAILQGASVRVSETKTQIVLVLFFLFQSKLVYIKPAIFLFMKYLAD